MKIAAQHPAPRSDSTLDTHLDPEQAEAFAHRLDCGMTLSEAADYLLEEHGLKLSRPSISRWVARRRRGKSDTTFARLAKLVKKPRTSARKRKGIGTRRHGGKEEHGEGVKVGNLAGGQTGVLPESGGGGSEEWVETNAVMLGQLIYLAGTGGDAYGMMHASKVFANVLGASAKAKRAATSQMAAQTARMKFEFSAAKAALAHADALHKISKECQGDEDAKMVRAIARMFGRRPTPSTVPLTEWEQRIEDAAIEIEAEEKAKANAEGTMQNAEAGGEEALAAAGKAATDESVEPHASHKSHPSHEHPQAFGDGARMAEGERIAEVERVTAAGASADGEPAVDPAGSSVEALPEEAVVAASAGGDGKKAKTSRWFDPGLTQSQRETAAREERQAGKLRRRALAQTPPQVQEPDEIDVMIDGRRWWRPKFRGHGV